MYEFMGCDFEILLEMIYGIQSPAKQADIEIEFLSS